MNKQIDTRPITVSGPQKLKIENVRGGLVILALFCFQIINLRQIQAVFEAFREISGYVMSTVYAFDN